MLHDRLAQDLYTEICRIPLIDAHSLLDPRQPTARHLEDLLGHPVYTELAHAAGMEEEALGPNVESRDRMRGILYQIAYFDNTTAYQWFLELARALLDFQGDRLGLADATWLCDRAEKLMARPDWAAFVLRRSNLEKVLVPRYFDDPLNGFDTTYVPYLNADDLVFHLDQLEVRQRLAKVTGIEVGDADRLRQAITKVFEQFKRHRAKACVVSLPADFRPQRGNEADLDAAMKRLVTSVSEMSAEERDIVASSVVWALAEQCRTGDVPLGLKVGVRSGGDPRSRRLFDPHTSLLTCIELFTAFPEVTFLVSVPSSQQNEELVRFSAFFPNVVTNGHWWNANVPQYIESDLRARLQAVPKIKQIGYFSDARTLEFALPRYSMYRRILSQVLADDFVRTHRCTEAQAVQLARMLLYDNVKRIFDV